MKKLLLGTSLFFSSSFFVLAQAEIVLSGGTTSSGATNPLFGLLKLIGNVLTKLSPILITVALLSFFWFLIVYIWRGSEDQSKRAEGAKGMMWSIVALFVMVSIWGIIGFMGSVTGIEQGGTINGFKIPGQK